LKIVHIINSLATGGAEKLLLETLPLYKEKGIHIDVVVLNGFEHPFMRKLQSLKCCTIFSLGSQSVYNPVNVLKIIPYLKKYDVVHVHLFPAQYWVVLAKILSFSKAKLIFTEHNSTNRRLENPLFRLIDKYIYTFYCTVICITEDIRTMLLKHTGSYVEKFLVIENGINLGSITKAVAIDRKKIDSALEEDDTILIQVAGFREQKDQSTLIRSMVLLPPGVKLLLVGEGVLKNQHKELVESLGLHKRVLFLGLRMDIPQLLKTADIIVLSSKYEGLSLSSIEGMASGKPFVASDVPGLSEVVSGAGILFSVGDEQALTNAISKLLQDAQYYETVATACQKRASNYAIETMVKKHITLYNSFAKS
jgi:glycosyltransferase involved in cell wall biosynthesis